MRVTVIYFSQTGNTQNVAMAMADVFHQENHHVRLLTLRDANADHAANCDLLGIGSPCFSSRAPQPVMRYLDALPDMKNHKAFVFATCGGAPGKVLYDMANALRKKGCDVLTGHLTRGEVNHPAPSLKGRFPGRPNAEDLIQTKRFAKFISEHLQNQSSRLPECDASSIHLKRGFYEFLGSTIADSTIRFFLPEPKVDLRTCDHCGYCSQDCPTNNINLAPYPVLGHDCIRCYHCYNECPRNALTLNWNFGNPILWLLYNQTFEKWFGDIKPGEEIYG